ncbi:MAG: FRG domain-containing protein [Balneolaceae bacterium]
MIHFYSDIRTIEEAVQVGIALDQFWFRGHSKDYGELIPGAFRKDNLGIFKRSRETSITEEFKRQAPAFSEFIPEEINHLEWLFIMQHYGSPTRLLDWSQNVLVALYFIVKQHFDHDGELWAIEPESLNEMSKHDFQIANTTDPFVKQLAAEAFRRLEEERDNDKLDIRGPIALHPPMRFPRMINQSSVFTIHPFPSDEHDSLSYTLEGSKFIVRYRIPKSRKKPLLNNLNSLGINEHTLFPNLDSLSKTIRMRIENEDKKSASNSPRIPRFD